MKKLIALILILALTLAGCSYGVSLEEYERVVVENAELKAQLKLYEDGLITAPGSSGNETIAGESDTSPAEFVSVSTGETITTDFVEIIVGTVDSGDKISEGYISYMPSNENNRFLWLNISFKNTAGSAVSLWEGMMAELVFDDTYTYEAEINCMSAGDMDPLVTNSVYIYAEVPPELIDSYSTVRFRFGFTEGFAAYDWEAHNYEKLLTNYDYLYEHTYTKG